MSVSIAQHLASLDKQWKKTKTTGTAADRDKLQRRLAASIAAWEKREYLPSAWQSTNERHREGQINTLTSLLKSINENGYLTPKQQELAEKLINNARELPTYEEWVTEDPLPPLKPATPAEPIKESFITSTTTTKTTNQSLTSQPIERIENSMSTIVSAPSLPIPAAQSTRSLLPTRKSPPKTDLSALTILVYGPTKIGKSTFCSQFDNALFLATEQGLNSLETFNVAIPTWQTLLDVAAEIAQGKHEFKNLVLDTVDVAYQLCRDYIFERNKISHESDLGFGKGYALVNTEFNRVLTKLSHLPYGLMLISHTKEEEIDTRTGKIKKTVPSISREGRKIILAMADMVLYCTAEMSGKDVKRVIKTKPTPVYEAGDRTGRLPEQIDLDFATFVSAYQNAVETNIKF